jgi:DNA-3-methyladenine glycosylase II
VAYQQLQHRRAPPSDDKLAEIAEAWRPWRAVAARLLWHFYLNKNGRRGG